MIYGYIRVSKNDQNLHLQKEALFTYKVEKIYEEKISGNANRKPVLESLLNELKPGDKLVIWRLDRLGRRALELIQLQKTFEENNIHLVSVTETLDTSTAMGKFAFQIVCCFAEMERNVIIERTLAGLAAAKKRGKQGGRPKGLSDEAKKKAILAAELYKQYEIDPQYSINELCDMIGVSKATFYRYIRLIESDF
ncbi:recombinase family protein [Tannerella forsythia]|uniref:recombinase family protein n=1 Tax=Tannerella forsythia TaxID=28112 RepID=UPI000618B071|nr:recombinase family protein [Tannerella forsythia]BAR50274.1 hypothetical protein TF3313_2862 [Tannerella forsythia 3313]